MKRMLVLLLVVVAAAAAERQIVEFRLRKDPGATMRGWILDYDQDTFQYETLTRDRRMRIRWDDLVDDDARRLRIGFKLDLSEDEMKGLIPGHELQFKGGGSVRGLLQEVDDDGTYWMRVGGILLPYPKERVAYVDEVKIKEEEAFSEEEVYVRRLERRPPQNAEEHRHLADYLYEIGNFTGAKQEYEKAIEMDPALNAEVAQRLADANDYLEDAVAAKVFAKEKSDAVLNGRWREAMDNIRTYIQGNPSARRRGEKLLGELEEQWVEMKRARFHAVKNDELDRAVHNYLRRKPSLEEARSWVNAELADAIRDNTARRLQLSDEEMEFFLESKAKGAPHWASYWTGSFIVSKRAKIGKSSKREARGDPEAWWAYYDDGQTQASWLKAYAAERLDLFEVVQVNMTPCTRCGGSGHVTKWSVRALPDGRHEWEERCPLCFGAGEDRGVGYR